MVALAGLALLGEAAEQQKFRLLAARYEKLMFHVARRILPRPQDAEDAVQEAFLAIARNFSKIAGVDHPNTKALVVLITENKAIDLARANARRAREVPLEQVPDLGVELPQERGLARCILRLPPRDRAWIQLRYAQGYTPREAAELLGLSQEAAYKLGQRAKKRLEALCREEGVL